MLRGRCGCRAVAFEVADEFVVAYNCHCSNCRATTGSAFLPWGEIEQEKLNVVAGAESLLLVGEEGADHEVRCRLCYSPLYWTVRNRGCVVVLYGALVDEPARKPMGHMFVGSKAPWYEIRDDLPRYDEHPWDS
jgi:hypothetical protein